MNSFELLAGDRGVGGGMTWALFFRLWRHCTHSDWRGHQTVVRDRRDGKPVLVCTRCDEAFPLRLWDQDTPTVVEIRARRKQA